MPNAGTAPFEFGPFRVGDSLISLLKQIRTGFPDRPNHFPLSICLIGVRDLRDYKIQKEEHEAAGALYSPFNIKAESLRLADFSLEEVGLLYTQHTQETGQKFAEEALQYAYDQTQGQPWLVNALAYQSCFRDVQDRSQPITKQVMKRAREELIKRRDTHIDALIDRLQDPRVRPIIDAIITGQSPFTNFRSDDVQYVRDLGLISQSGYAITNPIYREIIPRVGRNRRRTNYHDLGTLKSRRSRS